MKIRILNIFLIIICFFNNALTETNNHLFKQFLPEKLQNNHSFVEQVSLKIESYANLHPELIYYVLKNTEFRFVKNITDPEYNFQNILLFKLSEYLKLRNTWYNRQRKNMQKELPILREAVRIKNMLKSSYLMNYSRDNISDVNQTIIDENIADFYACIYLSNKEMKYDHNLDYNTIKEQEIRKLVNYFVQQYDIVDNLHDRQKKEVIKTALKYPFIFNDTYLPEFDYITPFRLFDFIHKMIDNDYFENYSINFQLAHAKHSVKFKETVTFKDIRFPYLKLSDNSKMTLTTDLNFSVGIKIKVKKYKTWLSYIKADMGTAYKSKLNIDKDSDFDQTRQVYAYKPGDPAKIFEGEYRSSTVTKDQNVVYARIYTPIYYLFSNLYFEAGLCYYHFVFKSEYYISRSATRQESGDVLDLNNDPKYIKKTLTKNIVSQYVSVNYDIFKFLTIKCESFNFPLSVSLGIETKINF